MAEVNTKHKVRGIKRTSWMGDIKSGVVQKSTDDWFGQVDWLISYERKLFGDDSSSDGSHANRDDSGFLHKPQTH